ncbi:MAG TPA: sugar-binding domain-containing protein [Bacteroidales bacterium]
MNRFKITCLILWMAILLSNSPLKAQRDYISLEGKWQFALDTASVGIQQKWYLSELKDAVNLPGTTDSNYKGFLNRDTTTFHLNRVYTYEGAAWYRKKVVIPSNFKDKHIQLSLERTKSTKVWIDGIPAGGSHILQTPQQFDVSKYLTPGEHFITIRVDNSLKLTPYGSVHIYSDDTQTNWNGIIGKIYLEATSKTYISDIQVYPDVDKKNISIRLHISNPQDLKDADIALKVEKSINGKSTWLKSQTTKAAIGQEITLTYNLGNECSLWDEYQQPLYRLTVQIANGDVRDSKTVPFGMRKFSVKGTQFAINGRITFLRGKHEGCVFPMTGFPPTDAEGWIRVYKIAKSYGINHYRFHSYCPPDAAFTAADMEGMYLQVELPFWGGLESDTLANMLKEEGIAMLKDYANHPSFVMFSHGNELWGKQDLVERNILAFKKNDNRPLYTMGSNNGIGYIPPLACSDFFVGARTPYSHDTILTHTRLTQAFVDSRDGGILNTQIPSTEVNFSYPVAHLNIPIISHEMGQYQTFPDYMEINKYTGVLRARNLEIFRNRLAKAGMLQMDSIFHKASGAWASLCYKAEMEAALRTNGLGGFQLLDLQDYPGQGTALVGILDAFMDSKKIITSDEWRQSCNDVVLLLEFPKYCWTTNENFRAKVVVSNYSNAEIHHSLKWVIKDQDGTILSQGTFPDVKIPCEGNTIIGEINSNLSAITKAEKLLVNIILPGTTYKNEYPVWVFKPVKSVIKPKDIIVSEKLDAQTILDLQKGAKVLLFPQTADVEGKSFAGLFPPEFWNYGMFKGISENAKKPVSPGTLGILTNPRHPIFNSFPTDFHTNWQWFSIIKASNSLILDNTSGNYQPIVEVIDNLERNHKLGLIFEFKVGEGKLLVCMSPLNRMMDKPEAVQLYQSMINYMESTDFNPDYSETIDDLGRLFNRK